MDTKCLYCHTEVNFDEPEWGHGDDLQTGQVICFHLECLEMLGNVSLSEAPFIFMEDK